MRVSSREWQNFVKKLSAINAKAGEEVESYIAKYGLTDVDALIKFCYEITNRYGNASASLAALMYDTVAELERVSLPAAELAALPEYSEVAETVNGVLKTSTDPQEIGGSIGRLVKRAGQDTLLQNAKRDKAEFAWIPSGAETCAYCIMLASAGWQPISKKSLKNGHAEHIHSNCQCTYMIRHVPTLEISGYNPNEYLSTYENADGKTYKEKLNTIRRNQYAAKKKEEASE